MVLSLELNMCRAFFLQRHFTSARHTDPIAVGLEFRV